MRRSLTAMVALAVLTGCGSTAEPVRNVEAVDTHTDPHASGSAIPTPPDHGQGDRLRAISKTYAHFTKVTPDPHVAPALCAAPKPSAPNPLRMSESTDAWTHGRKVYYLYATHGDTYVHDAGHDGGAVQPDDQVLVKESFVAEETTYEDAQHGASVGIGDKIYKPGARGALFVMAKHEGAWEFGTVSPTGEVAVEGPATASCHSCHDAKPDKLFGLGGASR
jgi:hypothetical protein